MRVEFVGGAVLASVSAGPMVATPLVVGLLVERRSAEISALASAPLIVILATLFGFAFSIVPNMIGASVLAWAGVHRPAFRHPSVWP